MSQNSVQTHRGNHVWIAVPQTACHTSKVITQPYKMKGGDLLNISPSLSPITVELIHTPQ